MPTNPDLPALSEAATKGDKADRFFAESALQEELMRLWFAGRLVHIDEGMRERVAIAISGAPFPTARSLAKADAAIAAMMGGAK